MNSGNLLKLQELNILKKISLQFHTHSSGSNIAGFDSLHHHIHQVPGDGDQCASILHLNDNHNL